MRIRGVQVASVSALAWLLIAASAPTPLAFPAPPPGYHWEPCKVIAGGLLVPPGWVMREEAGKNCSLTRDAAAGGEAAGHLVIAIIKKVPEHTGLKPSEMAAQYVKAAAKGNELVREWGGPQGPFQGFGIELRQPKTDKSPCTSTCF